MGKTQTTESVGVVLLLSLLSMKQVVGMWLVGVSYNWEQGLSCVEVPARGQEVCRRTHIGGLNNHAPWHLYVCVCGVVCGGGGVLTTCMRPGSVAAACVASVCAIQGSAFAALQLFVC